MTAVVVPSSRLTRASTRARGARGGVEGAGGLVAEEHVGPLGDGAGDGHALLLAAGELRGEVVGGAAEPHEGEGLVGVHRVAGDVGDEATFSAP
jgi:hypothetical protein